MHTLASYDVAAEWEVFSQLVSLELTQTKLWLSRLSVSGMHCAACAIKLEAAFRTVPGVVSSQVSAASAQLSILWDEKQTKPSTWMEAARRVGYELHPANSSNLEEINAKQTKLALWRWLVAGFCMMQIMMYAAPQYFSDPGEISTDIVALLRWASWVLSLPLLLFSSGPFFSSALRDLRDKHIGMDLPVALGIAITFLVSSAATFDPGGWWGQEVYFDSLSMFVFFILSGRWLEQLLRQKTVTALTLLERGIPDRVARKLADGSFENIALARLAVGDLIRILRGQRFPADGILIGTSTIVNEAFLTGESRPLTRNAGQRVLAGSYNMANPCEVKVDAVGQRTRFSQITKLMRNASLEKPRLALLADRVAKPFLMLVFFAAALAAFYWWPLDPVRGLMSAVAILIVTCPCALSLATPSAMLNASGGLADLGVLVCRAQGLEALSQVDTVVFDKTGTLTQSQLGLMSVCTRPGVDPKQALELAAALAKHSLHPASRALVAHSTLGHLIAPIFSQIREISGQGLEADLEALGDLDTTHFAVGRVMLGNAIFCGVTDGTNRATTVYLSDRNGMLAQFELDEATRQDASNTVALLQAYGLHVRLLSGDKMSAARRIGSELGIQEVDAECTPESKLQLLRELQKAGRKVLMVGDGVNDGPALSAAHASIAMGVEVPLAVTQADFVIVNEKLLLIPILLEHAKRTMRIVRQNLIWAASYNMLCVPLAILGYLPAWAAGLGMAASSLLVIANASRLVRIKHF